MPGDYGWSPGALPCWAAVVPGTPLIWGASSRGGRASAYGGPNPGGPPVPGVEGGQGVPHRGERTRLKQAQQYAAGVEGRRRAHEHEAGCDGAPGDEQEAQPRTHADTHHHQVARQLGGDRDGGGAGWEWGSGRLHRWPVGAWPAGASSCRGTGAGRCLVSRWGRPAVLSSTAHGSGPKECWR
jgi:hypothetical protein